MRAGPWEWGIVSGRFEAIAFDPEASRRFGRHALETRARGGGEPTPWVRAYEERLDAGSVTGRLWLEDGRPVGFVSWSPGTPIGLSIDLLYAETGADGSGGYARLLRSFEQEVGPVGFVSGPLTGLEPSVEDRLLRPLGFRRYSRSEMVLEASVDLPPPPLLPGEQLRPVAPGDLPELAELHRRAYHDRFDRFLFLEVPDEAEDARRGVSEILDGRWGEFSPAGSWRCDRAGLLLGAVLAVRSASGTLIADVAVDPTAQRAGVGRRVLTTALRSLRGVGERRIYLNVTEGNEPALRLYRGLGFVRSLGPTRDWYCALRIPVPPSPDA